MSVLEKHPIRSILRIFAKESNVSVSVNAGASIIVMFCTILIVVLWALSIIQSETQAIKDGAAVIGEAKAQMDSMERAYKEQTVYYKLYERRMLDWEAYLASMGIKLPSDQEFGPLGNLRRLTKQEGK